jgi:hypothetical protein
MAFHRDIEGSNHEPARPGERFTGRHERRPAEDGWQVATGTLACPSCDVPVLPEPGGMAPSEPMTCAYCGHGALVREFLSLAEPTRPTRVAVRVRITQPSERARS